MASAIWRYNGLSAEESSDRTKGHRLTVRLTAPLPAGADTVVQFEDTDERRVLAVVQSADGTAHRPLRSDERPGRVDEVTIFRAPKPGQATHDPALIDQESAVAPGGSLAAFTVRVTVAVAAPPRPSLAV